jgi:hypothetical protein
MRGGSRRLERGSRLSKSFTRGKLIHKLCSFELYGTHDKLILRKCDFRLDACFG